MKKLGKLSINVDKIIKNEELVNLRGGDYYDEPCTCTCYNWDSLECLGYLASYTGLCAVECYLYYGGHVVGECGNLNFCESH